MANIERLEPVGGERELEGARRFFSLVALLASKTFLPYWIALFAAVGLAAGLSGRTGFWGSNVDLEKSGFSESFLMFDKTDKSKVFLLDRRDSTVRRGRNGYPGKSWRAERIPGENGGGGRGGWLLRSKKYGTIIFTPLEEVGDWAFPFYYDFVRVEFPGLGLPRSEWTELYVDRIGKGLYLRMELPDGAGKKQDGSGARGELIMARGASAAMVDAELDGGPGLYADLISAGVFPPLAEISSSLAWLAGQAPTDESVFFLNAAEPYEVAPLPYPVSLEAVCRKSFGAPLERTFDERFQRWREAADRFPAGSPPPFEGEQKARFERGFAEYAAKLQMAIAAQKRLFGRSGGFKSQAKKEAIAAAGPGPAGEARR